jgi:hypothetical protein
MGLISWLVAIGCLLIGSGIGVWGLTDVSRVYPIWFLGVPGAILLIIALGFELQNYGTQHAAIDQPGRPWVSVFRMAVAPIQVGDFRSIIRFKNTGQSPALPNAIPPDASTIVILPGDDPPMDIIGKEVLTPEIVADIASGKRTIWIAGRIEYRDRDRNSHLTTFRAAYVPGSNRFRSTDSFAD